MRVLHPRGPDRPDFLRRLLTRLGRGPVALKARTVLGHVPAIAAQEIIRLAEESLSSDVSDPAAQAELKLTCLCLVRLADDDAVARVIHEAILDSFVYLYDPAVTAACIRLLRNLVDRRRAEYAPLLDRYLSSRLDTERALAAAALTRLRSPSVDDVPRLLRVVRDPSPRVVAAAPGALHLAFRLAGPGAVHEAALTLPPDVLETALVPPPSLHPRWFAWARLCEGWLAERVSRTRDDAPASVHRALANRTRALKVVWTGLGLTVAAGVAAVLGLAGLPSGATLHRMALAAAGFGGLTTAVLLSRVARPYLRYRSLNPATRMLELVEAGRGEAVSPEDLRAVLRDDEPGQRRLVGLAVDDRPGARTALLRLVAEGEVRPVHFEDQALPAAGSPRRRDRFVELLATLSGAPGGRPVVHHVLDHCWHLLSESPRIDLLLDADAPLAPPLLRLALERLRTGPLRHFRLLLRVCVEAPHLWPTWRAAVMEGLGHLFRQGMTFPDVVYHFLQLYPDDVYKALLRGYRFDRRDAEARRSFVDSLDRDTVMGLAAGSEIYRPTRHRPTVDRVMTAVAARCLDEAPDAALDTLFELAAAGLDDAFFARLPAGLRDEGASTAARALTHLLRAGGPDTVRELEAATAALGTLEDEGAKTLRSLAALLADLVRDPTPESVVELATRLSDPVLRRSPLLAGLRPVNLPIREALETLAWALDCEGPLERSTCLLKAHGLFLELLVTIRRRVPRPLRDVLLGVVDRIRELVAADVRLEAGSDPAARTRSRLAPELRSTDASAAPPAGPGFLGEATALLRSYWDIVAPPPDPPPLAPTPGSPDAALEALRGAATLLERAAWIDDAGPWPTWTVPPPSRTDARLALADALARLGAPETPATCRLEAIRALAPTGAATIRRTALPVIAAWLDEDDELRRTAAGDCERSAAADDPALPRRLAALHLGLLRRSPPPPGRVDELLASLERLESPATLEPETLIALGRAAAVDDRARQALEALAASVDGLRLLPAHLELALAGDDHGAVTLRRLLAETGRPFREGPLFPALIIFAPAPSLRRYREWLDALFSVTRRVGAGAAVGHGPSGALLDALEGEEAPKVRFAALIERGLLATRGPEPDAGALTLALDRAAEAGSEFRQGFLSALLRRRPEAWPMVERLAGEGALARDLVLAALRDVPPRILPQALPFLEEHEEALAGGDGATLLRHVYALVDPSPSCRRLLERLVLQVPVLMVHPAQEAFWSSLHAVDPEGALTLVRSLVAAADDHLPPRHLPTALAVVARAPGAEAELARLVSLCRRFRGDHLGRLGAVADLDESLVPLLVEALEDRDARPEDHRGALVGLARAATRTDAAHQILRRALDGGRLPLADREVVARELAAELPAHPRACTDLLLRHDLLDRLGAAGPPALGLAVASLPEQATNLVWSTWDHDRALRLRHEAPDQATALRFHLPLLLERGRMEGPTAAFERARACRALLEEADRSRAQVSVDGDAEARLRVFDFLEFLAAIVAGRTPPPPRVGTDGPLANPMASVGVSLSVLAELTSHALRPAGVVSRLVHLAAAERTVQELLLTGLHRLPPPLAEAAEWAVRALAERLATAEARPVTDPRLEVAPLTPFLPSRGRPELALLVTNGAATPLTEAVVAVTLTGAAGTAFHEEVAVPRLRPFEEAVVRTDVVVPDAVDGSLALTLTLTGHPLPGQTATAERRASLPVGIPTTALPSRPAAAPRPPRDDADEGDFRGGPSLSRTAALELLEALGGPGPSRVADREEALILTARRPGWLRLLIPLMTDEGTAEAAVATLRRQGHPWLASRVGPLSPAERRVLGLAATLSSAGHRLTPDRLVARLALEEGGDGSAAREATASLLACGALVPGTGNGLALPCPLADHVFARTASAVDKRRERRTSAVILPFPGTRR